MKKHNLACEKMLSGLRNKYKKIILVLSQDIIEQDLITKSKKSKNFKEYILLLKSNKIVIDQSERQKIILKKYNSFNQKNILIKKFLLIFI